MTGPETTETEALSAPVTSKKKDLWRVTGGPSVWRDQVGEMLFLFITDNGTEIVLELESKDDAGTGTFQVRLPYDCVTPVIEKGN